ncbi:MAG: CoA transferase [Betaproteobacteria bacterium]|nr:CoA transferase [Betaproteobacteria bacterium]
MSQSLPLQGIRIIAVEQYGAGPYGSSFMADLGAEVIKIENHNAGGDVSRANGPFFLGEGDSEFFQTFNANKKSFTLDLKAPGGREVFEKLVASADAVLNNLRGDQPAKLGLDYTTLKSVKPAIVCAHLSAYGRDNDRAEWPGYDYLMQAEAGFCLLTGEPDGPPARFGLSVVDFMTGMTMSIALLSGVIGAMKSGRGRDVDVSLFDVALHQLSYPATWYLNNGHVTQRMPRGAHPATVPAQMYKARDGHVFVLCMIDKFWRALCEGLGIPALADDARFNSIPQRRINREALTPILDAEFEKHTPDEWMQKLGGVIPIAPVYNMAQGLDNPYVAQVGMIQTLNHPANPALRRLANPIKVDGARVPVKPAPPMGADTEPLLKALGFDGAGIAKLRVAKAIA